MYIIQARHFAKGYLTGITRNYVKVKPKVDETTLKFPSIRAAYDAIIKHGWMFASLDVIELEPNQSAADNS